MSNIEKNGLNIVIDDGSVRVPIHNNHGDEIGVFYFRPTDIGMVERYNKVAADFEKITEPLESVSIKPDGTVDEEEQSAEYDAFKEAEKRLFDACDYLFGGNMSEAFFGSMHPFSPVNGKFYCENALDAVGKFIAKQFDSETAKITARVAKYTKGYAKPHKAAKKKK